MRLLIITQRVDIDDDNLGFFHRWLEKIAEKVDELYIICLSEGKYHLPQNTKVYSLGKEQGYSKLRQFIRLQKFLLRSLPKVDGVFVHMCPIYAIVSFPLAKIFRKKTILWFLHKKANWKLKLAEKCVDKILTASKESCRLKNRKKIEIVGHGIDIELFKPQSLTLSPGVFRIFSPGRISPIKGQRTLIEAIDVLVNGKGIKDIEVGIAGTPIEKYEEKYLKELENLVREKGLESYIKFLGGVVYREMPQRYEESDLMISLSDTGSVDKVVLEGMASGCLVLTCNEAFQEILPNKYLFKKRNTQDLAEKIINLKKSERDESLREMITEHYNLDNLIDRIISEF